MDLTTSSSLVASLERVLTVDEVSHADRYRFEYLRQRYVLGRGVLRHLLSHYLDREANSINLSYGDAGKPFLASDSLCFNISHCSSKAVFAFTMGCALGVDIEDVLSIPDMMRIAEHFFASGEIAALRSLPPSDRARGFYKCWTRKEAYLKARGAGISVPLNSFTVSLREEDPVRLISVSRDLPSEPGWTLEDISCFPDYAAALAYRSARRRLWVRPHTEPERILEEISAA